MPNPIKVLGKTYPVNTLCIWFIPVLSIFDTGTVSEMDFSKGPSLGEAMTVMPNHSFISIQLSLFTSCWLLLAVLELLGAAEVPGGVCGLWPQLGAGRSTVPAEFTWSKRSPSPNLPKAFILNFEDQ